MSDPTLCLVVGGNRVDAVADNRIHRKSIGGIGVKSLFELIEVFQRNVCVHHLSLLHKM